MNVNIIQTGRVHTLLNAVTSTGAGTSYPKVNIFTSFQAYGTTSAGSGSADIKIQVSNDDSNWIDLGTISLTLGTTATTDGFASEAPWRYVRGNVDSISGTDASVTLLMGM